MKIRTSFVSNSSSASFILKKDGLSELHRLMVLNHIECGKMFLEFFNRLPIEKKDVWIEMFCIPIDKYDKWHLEETEDKITGHTNMTNFSLEDFFGVIGIDEKLYEFDYD